MTTQRTVVEHTGHTVVSQTNYTKLQEQEVTEKAMAA